MYSPTQPGIAPDRVGVSGMQALTTFDSEPYVPPPGVEADLNVQDDEHPAGGNPTNWLVLMILGLVVLGILHASSRHLQQTAFGISFYTVLVIVLVATVGQKLGQVLFTKYPVPGLTQIFHS